MKAITSPHISKRGLFLVLALFSLPAFAAPKLVEGTHSMSELRAHKFAWEEKAVLIKVSPPITGEGFLIERTGPTEYKVLIAELENSAGEYIFFPAEGIKKSGINKIKEGDLSFYVLVGPGTLTAIGTKVSRDSSGNVSYSW